MDTKSRRGPPKERRTRRPRKRKHDEDEDDEGQSDEMPPASGDVTNDA